jgi:hypothetical protein
MTWFPALPLAGLTGMMVSGFARLILPRKDQAGRPLAFRIMVRPQRPAG